MSVDTLAKALFEAGLLDATSMETRISRSRNGRALLDGIVGDGVISEANLVTQLARVLSVPRYDPKERSPEPDALALIDTATAEELGVLPVAVRGGGSLLWVALCDPTDEPLQTEIARRTGRRVKPCLIGPRELSRAILQVQRGVGIPTPVGTPLPGGFGLTGTTGGGFRVPTGVGMTPAMPLPYGAGTLPPNGVPPGGTPGVGSYAGYPFVSGMNPGTPIVQTTPGMAGATGQSAVRSNDVQRLDDELAQVRRVVKVLTQMLVERGALDGEELKRRLRAERDRKS
jgi:hypothetical protein